MRTVDAELVAANRSTPSSRSVLGFSILALLVSCSAVWLSAQTAGEQQSSFSSQPVTNVTTNVDELYLPDDNLLGFVEIPAGAFVMGSDSKVDVMAYDNERWLPQTTQGELSPAAFYIGRYEVTVGQFQAFATATAYKVDGRATRKSPDHPVTYVSWADALAYCHWLERQLRQSNDTPDEIMKLLNSGWHISLPSEAQWEKAARGSDGRIYPWGATAEPSYANYRGSGTKAVGSYDCPRCSYGLADMSGNVWEYTRSPYQPYPYDDADDRKHLQADALWVMRGGSFSDGENNVRAAVRGGIDPGVRNGNTGFRLVLEKTAPEK